MLIEHLDVEADALLGGEGVHVAADGIDLARDFLCSPVFGPFEDHVLDKMGDAIPFRIFVARSGLQPDANRSGADVLHLLGNYREPIGQLLTTNIAHFLSHCFLAYEKIVTNEDQMRSVTYYSYIGFRHVRE